MSKELKALERVNKAFHTALIFADIKQKDEETEKALNIIETALKEKEEQDGVLKIFKEVIGFTHMLPLIEPIGDTGLKLTSAVEINIRRDIENKERELLRQWVLETCFPKELKALEIIKEKRVNVRAFLKCCHRIDGLLIYNNQCDNKSVVESKELTQEEYDLLKEALL